MEGGAAVASIVFSSIQPNQQLQMRPRRSAALQHLPTVPYEAALLGKPAVVPRGLSAATERGPTHHKSITRVHVPSLPDYPKSCAKPRWSLENMGVAPLISQEHAHTTRRSRVGGD